MLCAEDFRVGDIVSVIDNVISLPNGKEVTYGTKAEVILTEDGRVDLKIVSTVTGLLQVGQLFSLFDAFGSNHNRDQSVASVDIIFRKEGNGPGDDYRVEAGEFPPPTPHKFKAVSGPPIIWDSHDCGSDDLASYGQRLYGD